MNANMKDATPADAAQQTQAGWGWLFLLGVLLILLGVLALSHLVIVTVASIVTIGIAMMLGGISHIILAFRGHGWKQFVLLVLGGLFYILAGAMVFANPLLASTFVTLVLAVSLLVAGVFRIWFGLRQRAVEGWGWPVFTGVVTLLLGLSVASGWPFNSLLIIGIFLGIDLLVQGLGYMTLALTLRSQRAG